MGKRLPGQLLGTALIAMALWPGVAGASPRPDPGKTTAGTITSSGSEYPYLLYTPRSYRHRNRHRHRRPAPLVVMVHGCQTTAEQELALTNFNRLAERKRFLVLYPEADAAGRAQPGPLRDCWRFTDPNFYLRDHGDAAGVAKMTREVIAKRRVNARRVYLVGVSAGGLLASVEAAAYPDLYTAVGLVASAGYLDGPCFTTGVGIPVELSAKFAFDQMGPRARIVPRVAIGSDGDLAFPASCTRKAAEQGLRTSNLVLSGSQTTPIALEPATIRDRHKPGGYGYRVSRYRDPDGCLVGERWIIHGMPHSWPGGTHDPKYKGYTDTKAPSGAKATWRFLSRYTMRSTAMPCAERRR